MQINQSELFKDWKKHYPNEEHTQENFEKFKQKQRETEVENEALGIFF